MSDTREAKVQSLKEQGNACVKDEKYVEAVFHYTHAIKLDPQNFSLYSNRSFVFLKMKQFYLAMEDALMTIQLKPDWTKGYFRKAEVEAHTFRFAEALESYNKALFLQPNDPNILKAMNTATRLLIQDRRGKYTEWYYQKTKRYIWPLLTADQQIPWLGAGFGIILGVIIIIADYVFVVKPTLTHPLLMALLTMAIAMIGYGIAKGCRYFIKCQRRALLEPPMDLLNENDVQNTNVETEKNIEKDKHPKYSKAQARQRMKKGKT